MRYLLKIVQLPSLVATGLTNWKRKTVPVGRSLMRLPSPERVLSEMLLLLLLSFMVDSKTKIQSKTVSVEVLNLWILIQNRVGSDLYIHTVHIMLRFES